MSEVNTTNTNRLYEVSFHIVSTISADKLSDQVSCIKEVLTKHKANIVNETEAKLMNLAYQMTKKISDKNYNFDKAYFGSIVFEAAPEDADNINTDLKLDDNILRFLIIKTVNDPEHSTNKVSKEKDEELASEESKEKSEGKVTEANEIKEEESTDDSSDSENIDEAIDELVK